MLGDVALQMPTDLRRSPKLQSFELDPPISSRNPEHSKGITALTVDIPTSRGSHVQGASDKPARWRTPEFVFYAVVFCVVVPFMVWVPVTLSSPSHPNYPYYKRKLSPGWLFGRQVTYPLVVWILEQGGFNSADNSDGQYRSFRNGIPALSGLLGVFFLLKTIYTRAARRNVSSQPSSNLYLVPFLLMFSILMVMVLHGTSIIKIAVILLANYAIAKACGGSRVGPVLTWVFNSAVLFSNEVNSGYRFASMHPSLVILDSIEGVYPRWHVGFNITMLRLVSFNMDYYWACNRAGPADAGQALDYKQRTTIAHSPDTYSLKNYIAYVLYPPLYIAGPIMTFNDFIWQLRRSTELPLRATLSYLFRFLICILTLEFILHFMYLVAIKDTKAWLGDSAAELSLIGFWSLVIVWLKLLVPWRFFRLWALLDGIDPPENMVRCVVNNYSTLGFWRSWHRSYNLWIVRYIYIPLGGAKNVIFTTILVFSFVALWHDLSFRLLTWGWLISLFILPEMAATYFLPASKYGEKAWYRHVCVFGGVLNILMMMTANLVGFVVGTDGVSYMLNQLFSTWDGIRFLIFACVCIFIGIQVMFEYREEEMRRKIYRRC